MTTKTKTCNVSKPKSVNSKKSSNNKSDIKFLKELNGQVIVSVEQYKSHPELFLGTPSHNLRLKDGREVIVSCVIGDMAFDLVRVAELLLSSMFFHSVIASSTSTPIVKAQAICGIARAYSLYTAIKDFLCPGHKKSTLEEMREIDLKLYQIVKYDAVVKQLVSDSQYYFENPSNPKFQFGNESIDVEYLAHLIEEGYRTLLSGKDDEFDSSLDSINYTCTVFEGCIMVTQLRHMKRKDAINYASKELGSGSKSCVETLFRMLTINKEAA